MSQTPVTSTSHADANINPSVTSHHTLENESIEASPMALAISNETELNAFPFMKLAVGQSSDYLCTKRTRHANWLISLIRNSTRNLQLSADRIPVSCTIARESLEGCRP